MDRKTALICVFVFLAVIGWKYYANNGLDFLQTIQNQSDKPKVEFKWKVWVETRPYPYPHTSYIVR